MTASLSTPRILALCADDFAQSPGVSETIVSLASAGRLSLVSCLVTGPHWRRMAPLLAELPPAVETGLHFNLTEGAPLSPALRRVWPRFPSLSGLLAAAHLRALPRQALAAEFEEQWKAYALHRGQAPDFVDGHQHVHQLPVVRDVVLEALAAVPHHIAVRATGRVLGPGFGAKRAVIERSGGRAMQQALVRRGIAHNRSLVGVYDFATDDYASLFRAWLAQLPADGALLFCHPGDADDPEDPIAPARAVEAAYFASARFIDDLGAAGVVVGPAWRRAAVPVLAGN